MVTVGCKDFGDSRPLSGLAYLREHENAKFLYEFVHCVAEVDACADLNIGRDEYEEVDNVTGILVPAAKG